MHPSSLTIHSYSSTSAPPLSHHRTSSSSSTTLTILPHSHTHPLSPFTLTRTPLIIYPLSHHPPPTLTPSLTPLPPPSLSISTHSPSTSLSPPSPPSPSTPLYLVTIHPYSHITHPHSLPLSITPTQRFQNLKVPGEIKRSRDLEEGGGAGPSS